MEEKEEQGNLEIEAPQTICGSGHSSWQACNYCTPLFSSTYVAEKLQ